LAKNAIPILAGDELTKNNHISPRQNTVGSTLDALRLRMVFVQFLPANRGTRNVFRVFGGDTGINAIVDGNGRRVVATAEAGNIANFDFAFWRAGQAAFEIRSQFASAVQVATHVRADANFRRARGGTR